MKNVEIAEVKSPLIKVIYDGKETIVNTNSVVFRKTFLSSEKPTKEEIYLRPDEVHGFSEPYRSHDDGGAHQLLVDYCFSIKGQRYRVSLLHGEENVLTPHLRCLNA